MKHLSIQLLSVALLALAGWSVADACTNLLVGKNASADGSTIITYAADSHTLFGDLQYLPAADHAPGSMREIIDWDSGKRLGAIPEVAHTYAVVGNMNEHQVTIAESTWGGREELWDTTGNSIIDYGSLMYIALQRSKTAREAIKWMTELVAKYGYASEGESFSIGDPNEIWIMDMIGKGSGEIGAVWVAIRIPDDCIAGHANNPRIWKFDMKDKKNVMYSKDVISFAKKKGLFSGKDADFAFAPVYQKFDAGALRGCDARVWSYFNRFHKGMDAYLPFIYGKTRADADVMPLYVKPDRKVSVRDMQEMMRDHFEGTPFDMTKDPGATTAYGVPYRWRPMDFEVDGVKYSQERAIATQQTGWVFAAQMRSWMPDEVGGCFWFGVDDANTAVFVPMYCCITKVPESYRQGKADMYTLDWDCAFWVNNWVANQAYARYSQMIGDIRKVQGDIEDTFAKRQSIIEAEATSLLTTDRAAAIRLLTEYSVNAGQEATARYRKLGEYLFVKYLDGNVKKEKDGKFLRNAYGTPASPNQPGYTQEYYEMQAKGLDGSGKVLKVEEPVWLEEKDKN
ncbi:MAG: C69 family dipeptidase [Muribaculaceae bacterium]|nr:C69 family dipeptidase [Muribaculaceae bacterium]